MTERLEHRVAETSRMSRSRARGAIRAGRVSVDGAVETDASRAIGPETLVQLDGEALVAPPWFVIFHKPVDVQCTVGDPWGRPHLGTTAADLVRLGLHPVGRLDADSSGLLPFSADGAVTQHLLHPRHGVEKLYVATVEGTPGPRLATALAAGVETAEGVHTAVVQSITGSEITLAVAEGKHRMVRRMLANSGFPVVSLRRIAFGALALGDLAPGEWRLPDDAEAAWLATLADTDRQDLLAEAERVGRMGSWLVGPGERLVWSDNLYRIFGIERGTPPGPEAFYAQVHPEDRERVMAFQREVWSPQGPRVFDGNEYRVVRPDGEIRWVRGAGSTVRDDAGVPITMCGTITDVTEEVRTRQALLDAHRMLVEAERIAHVGSFVWDPATRHGDYSVEFLRILGLQPGDGESVLTRWSDYLHPEDRDAQARWFADVLRTGGGPPLRVKVVREGGVIGHAEVRAVIHQDADGRVTRVFGTLHDITERVALEQGLAEGARHEAMGNVAAGVAHDLNNYLTVLQGALDLFRVNGVSEEALRAGQRAMEQCASLTRNLLTYARNQPFSPVDLDVGAVLHDAAALLRRLVGTSVEVVVEVPSEPVYARADRGSIENVLVNLGVNARDAMPSGGRLALSADRPGEGDVRTALPAPAEAGEWVRISVQDSGVGIDPDDLGRIFEPFFTTKRSKGTGLGLPSVRGTIRQHGGHITVHSEPGQGTRFEAWLPAAHPSFGVETPSVHLRTVLVVDDVAEVRELASRFLHRGGWRTVEAGGVDEALALLAQGGIDAVLSDVVMPERTGFDLLRAVRGSAHSVPVVLMTGWSEVDEGDSLDTPIVRKPFRQADLLASLELVVRPRSNP